MTGLRILKLDEVTNGDTYEIAYAHSYPANHWSKDSLYITDDDSGIQMIEPYLDAVFSNYAYYGPQKITLAQWKQVEVLAQNDTDIVQRIGNFFEDINNWLKLGNQKADYFWILGI